MSSDTVFLSESPPPSPSALAKALAAREARPQVYATPRTWYGRLWTKCCATVTTCTKVIKATADTGIFLSSAVLRGTKFNSFVAAPLGTTLSSFGIGFGLQRLCQRFLPDQGMQVLNQFNKDNQLMTWAFLTNLFLYYTEDDSDRKEAILSLLAGFVGSWTALKIHDLTQIKLSDMPDGHVALLTKDDVEGGSNSEGPANLKCELFGESLNPLTYVMQQAVLKLPMGIYTCVKFNHHPFGLPVGIFLISDWVGLAIGEAFQSIKALEITNPTVRTAARLAFVFLEGSWGLAISFFPGNKIAHAYAGLATGVPKPFYKRRFERVPPDLQNHRLNSVTICNRFTHLAFGVAFGLWVQTNYPESPGRLGERIALIVCCATLPTVYLVKTVINRYFKWGHHHPIVNSIKFYLEDYTVPSGIVFCLVEEFNGLGSKVLREDDLVKSFIAPAIGWTAYITALGASMTTVQPRPPLALDGMSNTFMAWLMKGKG